MASPNYSRRFHTHVKACILQSSMSLNHPQYSDCIRSISMHSETQTCELLKCNLFRFNYSTPICSLLFIQPLWLLPSSLKSRMHTDWLSTNIKGYLQLCKEIVFLPNFPKEIQHDHTFGFIRLRYENQQNLLRDESAKLKENTHIKKHKRNMHLFNCNLTFLQKLSKIQSVSRYPRLYMTLMQISKSIEGQNCKKMKTQ